MINDDNIWLDRMTYSINRANGFTLYKYITPSLVASVFVKEGRNLILYLILQFFVLLTYFMQMIDLLYVL